MNTQTEDQTLHNAALVSRDQSLPPQPSTFHKTFIGADGLRAGWSILIFIALFAVLMAPAAPIVPLQQHAIEAKFTHTSRDTCRYHDSGIP